MVSNYRVKEWKFRFPNTGSRSFKWTYSLKIRKKLPDQK
jgi:hypothetical protein